MTWDKARQAILDSSPASAIYIGCDSRRIPSKKKALFSTVIVLHVDSNKGCKVFHNRTELADFGSLRARLLTEVQLALDAFYAIEDIVGKRKLEVHLDVNPDPKHASNIVTSEALGWVRGLGITAQVKPNSFAASTAADHCVNH
jgi:predicted RNase H-related nuclease YkuK (DUF458 family)